MPAEMCSVLIVKVMSVRPVCGFQVLGSLFREDINNEGKKDEM